MRRESPNRWGAKWFATAAFMATVSLFAETPDHRLADELLQRIPQTFALATRQYEFLLENLKGQTNIPRTVVDGKLKLVAPKDWTSGFFPGSMWYLYEFTSKTSWKTAAQDYTARLESIKDYGGSHDVGFILNCSYGNGYRLTRDPHYREVLIDSFVGPRQMAISGHYRYHDESGTAHLGGA
jgi:hypothetical protein